MSLEGQDAGGGMLEGQLEQLEQLEQLLTVAAPGAGQPFPCLQGHTYVADEVGGEAEGDGEAAAGGDKLLDCQEGGRGQGQRERHLASS